MPVSHARIALLAAALTFAPAVARAQTDADIANYTLTMDVMKQLASAGKDLKAVLDQDPALAEAVSSDEDEWAETVAVLEKSPAAIAALKKSGLTPREYVMGVAAFGQAAMVVALQQQDKTYEAPPGTNAKNVAFVKAHWEELQKLIGVSDQ